MAAGRGAAAAGGAVIDGVLAGDRAAIARALSAVERDPAGPLAAALHRHGGRAHVVGVTGVPGAGKSTLVAALIGAWRGAGRTVGVLAVDPSSPLSGGAILGDRVRMDAGPLDDGVFIRSMANRGAAGGLALAASGAVRVLDAAGYDVVVVETVGAGQSEVEIADEAHTTVVVVPPGLGDGVQALKAGILEVADVFALNKADLPGADRAAAQIEAMLKLGHTLRDPTWQPPVVRTVATSGDGVVDLVAAIDAHAAHLHAGDGAGWRARERARAYAELRRMVIARFAADVFGEGGARPAAIEAVVDALVAREIDVGGAAAAVLEARRDG
ncbi:MAG: methylmalonyl Co-A mutase-associated GTPase MeaB [Ardenticatenales bacterium]|nr:methylmalonyl Co-A mutase-associated GTPase MeaB [Ardenticatenales bacterium]